MHTRSMNQFHHPVCINGNIQTCTGMHWPGRKSGNWPTRMSSQSAFNALLSPNYSGSLSVIPSKFPPRFQKIPTHSKTCCCTGEGWIIPTPCTCIAYKQLQVSHSMNWQPIRHRKMELVHATSLMFGCPGNRVTEIHRLSCLVSSIHRRRIHCQVTLNQHKPVQS